MTKSSIAKIEGNFKGKDILSIDQFSPKDFSILFSTASRMKKLVESQKPSSLLVGKIVTLVFYEPSTRTFSSFSSAVKRLGGQTIEHQNPLQTSSAVKGETLEDTMRMFEAYSDLIVIRHPDVGSASNAANAAKFVPVINAGDGPNEHPTQALLDLYTIYEKFGKLNHLTGVAAGDILYGRTIKSLLRGLAFYPGNTVYLLSPRELKLLKEDFSNFSKRGIKLIEIGKEEDLPKNAHFWYWTRTQKERFKNATEYEKVKNRFILTEKLVDKRAGRNTLFMHPLPRVGEIATEVDNDPRAVYLTTQARNGTYVRMALLALVLGKVK